jgi:gas vesicle protein
MRERATQVRDTTREQLGRAKSSLDTLLNEQPLALGAVGLAIGAIAAALAPRTAQEERVAGKIDDMVNPESTPAQENVSSGSSQRETGNLAGSAHIIGEPKQDPIKKQRDDERERLQQGVKPYAERNESEPPV